MQYLVHIIKLQNSFHCPRQTLISYHCFAPTPPKWLASMDYWVCTVLLSCCIRPVRLLLISWYLFLVIVLVSAVCISWFRKFWMTSVLYHYYFIILLCFLDFLIQLHLCIVIFFILFLCFLYLVLIAYRFSYVHPMTSSAI